MAPLRYVALGDSYTIGTSVAEDERWPNQLVAVEPRLELVANLGVNGYTSRDVIDLELPQLDELDPEFLTILIGVNDAVQRVPAPLYRENLGRILDALVAHAGAGRVLAITTPDYTVTPSGADYGDPARQSAAVRSNNAILREVAGGRLVGVVDIHDLSLKAGEDRSLVAADGLHPSARQYVLWMSRIFPAVRHMLADVN
jgi:lysophospholipase L1-like esterase